jgi:PiT family inorganic phosphate transporter
MEVESILKILVLMIGFYMSWNIGANDVSNAMGTSVGSGALTLRRAVILASILEFSGAFFVGSNVSETMQRGLIDTSIFITEPTILILGMSAALLSTSLWLQMASYFGWPVSTTHAIVGAILGFGGVVGGAGAIQWGEVGSILLSWVLSPVLSALFSYLLFSVLQKKILYAMSPAAASIRLFPYMTMVVFGIFTLSLIFNGLENINVYLTFPQALLFSILVGGVAFVISYLILSKKNTQASQSEIINTPPRVVSI